ncbi:hypothetical protein MBLNU457_g2491t1 [Dothideomycetes sp. NU457]
MARCVCSVRLLETFVKDVAGFDIRRSQVSLQPRRNVRPLSTRAANIQRRPQTRNLETIAAGRYALDDTYVPFDIDTKAFEPARPLARTTAPSPPPQDVLEHLHDLEPEITVKNQDLDMVSEQAKIEMLEKLEQDAARMQLKNRLFHDHISMDSVTVPAIHQIESLAVSKEVAMQKLDVILPERTRVDRRKERKARRMEAKKAASSIQDSEGSEVKSMLAEAQQPKSKKPQKAKAEDEKLKTTTTAPTRKDARQTTSMAAKKMDTQKTAMKASPTAAVKPHKKEPWQSYKAALKEKFGDVAWTPRKRISPDALAGIRALRASQPEVYTTERLAEHFKMSPEAIRRILRSKWQPTEEEMDDRRRRWEKRGIKKWTEMAEEGVRPPKKWRELGVGRTEDGQAPKWKRMEFDGKVKGERWIEQPATDVFVRAADAESDAWTADTNIVERIL